MTPETIYLIGGTTEANRAADRLNEEGYRVIVSVATPLGEALASASDTETGRKSTVELAKRAGSLDAVAFVDCSHPFALKVSGEARRAAEIVGIPYFRYTRPASPEFAPGVSITGTWQEAVHLLEDLGCRSLLTIGTRNLGPFAGAGLDFTARVLPVPESLEECARLGIGPEKIIAAHPPYSVDFNRACIRRARAGALLTKDSGPEGGLPEKLEAAAAESAHAIIVARPEEPGAIDDLDALIAGLGNVLAQNHNQKQTRGSMP